MTRTYDISPGEALLRDLDYRLLREQKRRLSILSDWLKADLNGAPGLRDFPNQICDEGGDCTTPLEVIGAAEGLLHFLGAVYDVAEENGYIDSSTDVTCVHCGLDLADNGVVLYDSTYGAVCSGESVWHCRGFAPDSEGDNPEVCIECHAHHDDHPGDEDE